MSQASPIRAARRMAGSTLAATMIGGPGRWSGLRPRPISSMVKCLPRWVTISSDQSLRITSIPSSSRETRSDLATPAATNSPSR